jgi:hypothetical protein
MVVKTVEYQHKDKSTDKRVKRSEVDSQTHKSASTEPGERLSLKK